MASKEQLLNDITLMMTDPSQAQNDTKIEEIMHKIRKLDPKKASDQLRLASCHFMTMYHTRKAMTIGMSDDPSMQGAPPGMMQQLMGGGGAEPPKDEQLNLEAVEKFKLAQRQDMELGWHLLNTQYNQVQAARTARVLKIEVAQRLEDSQKLKIAFDDLMSKQLSEEENMVAFTAAPFLGDWKTMMKLGKKIEKMPGGMEQLHMMSLQLPIPDFTLVYALCKEYKLNRQATPKVESLTWQLHNVEKIRVKFRDVDCGEFEQKRNELLDEIKKQGDVEWEDVPNTAHVHVKRMGALCQAVSFGEIPMMLNGPWLEDKIHVRGRAEMPLMNEEMQQAQMNGGNPFMGGGMPDPSQMTILIQEEEWDLTQDTDNPKLYSGTYALRQRPQLPEAKAVTPEHAPVNMMFDCQVFIGDDTTGNNNNNAAIKGKSEEKNPNDPSNAYDDEKANADDEEDGESDECAQDEEEQNDAADAIVTEFDDLELD
mmetsp:Transcript_32625/g.52912  ORF Transcript_32625/g.52912 Transcript_32625/m.52912 type:complete len:482 (-) Transcript_32625:1051-2496(-)|eukprot:CAMPEP_0202687216 /NCGR_PEP_ID=MMETSP1385-20130828/2907_1 /ASSEMBLY_ACC=CAM_ASM_000861 /TAXON_ID=933848 /ORGANISM="Elphidium margaritaceum" /LENGTH=481 /DNA_ID=CAMNT_0049341969 /DNA_START=115 /DNA_END=1560 /DNA_ORIENTATION=+